MGNQYEKPRGFFPTNFPFRFLFAVHVPHQVNHRRQKKEWHVRSKWCCIPQPDGHSEEHTRQQRMIKLHYTSPLSQPEQAATFWEHPYSENFSIHWGNSRRYNHLFRVDIADEQNYCSDHKERQISGKWSGVPKTNGNSEKHTGYQAMIKTHLIHPPFFSTRMLAPTWHIVKIPRIIGLLL